MGASRVGGWTVGLVVVGLALGGVLVRAAIVSSNAGGPVEIHGVRLGMTPRDVRDRFAAFSPGGQWRTTAAAGELALEWLPASTPAASTPPPIPPAANDGGTAEPQPPSAAAPARFEFHNGLLVAVRLVVPPSDPAAHGAPVDVSTASVLARRGRTDGRVELTLLARDCPTHAEEVHRLLARR